MGGHREPETKSVSRGAWHGIESTGCNVMFSALVVKFSSCSSRLRRNLTLHLALVVYDDATVIFKVDENTILSSPCFALPHHHGRHYCTYVHVHVQIGYH